MSDTEQCFFCDQQATRKRRFNQPGMHEIQCPRCGEYALDEDAYLEFDAHPLEGVKRFNASCERGREHSLGTQ